MIVQKMFDNFCINVFLILSNTIFVL